MKEATYGTIRNINQKQDIVKHKKKQQNKQTKNLHLVGSEFEVKIDISMT